MYLRTDVPDDRTNWLDYSNWTPIGPFEKAFDYFGDGSIYIVDATSGHIPGHINALVRTSPDGKWAFLAGDAAHDMRLITGEKEIGHYKGLDGEMACAHENKEMAVDYMRRIGRLPEEVSICISHDIHWKERFISL